MGRSVLRRVYMGILGSPSCSSLFPSQLHIEVLNKHVLDSLLALPFSSLQPPHLFSVLNRMEGKFPLNKARRRCNIHRKLRCRHVLHS